MVHGLVSGPKERSPRRGSALPPYAPKASTVPQRVGRAQSLQFDF